MRGEQGLGKQGGVRVSRGQGGKVGSEVSRGQILAMHTQGESGSSSIMEMLRAQR